MFIYNEIQLGFFMSRIVIYRICLFINIDLFGLTYQLFNINNTHTDKHTDIHINIHNSGEMIQLFHISIIKYGHMYYLSMYLK